MPESIKSGARTIRQAALIVVPVISLFIILFADLEPGKPQVTYTFAIAYSASIGGISTLVGTPPNLSFARIVNIIFPEMTEISFADWFIFAVPVTILLFGAAWLLLYLMYRPKKSWKGLQMDDFRSEYNSLGHCAFVWRRFCPGAGFCGIGPLGLVWRTTFGAGKCRSHCAHACQCFHNVAAHRTK